MENIMTEKLHDQVIAIFDKLNSDKRADLIATIGTHYFNDKV
jgi:hypothetical protein